LDKVRRGDDLTPHLSIAPHTRGYAPAAGARGAPPEDRWSDKDFVLNIMGYHHFHLGTTVQKRGHVGRTDELIFAEVGREAFNVVAIFDHEVFESNSAERRRLWSTQEAMISRQVSPGSIVIPAMIATSGHAVHVVRYAQRCAQIIAQFEPKLDDSEFVQSLYQPAEEPPTKSKLRWAFKHLDLGIVDDARHVFMILQKGWN
jgi:hypothetical protein